MAKLSAMEISSFWSSIVSLVAVVVAAVAIMNTYISNRRARMQAVTVKAIDIMEATREDRHILYSYRDSEKKYPDGWETPESPVRKAANNASRAFDILGILDATNQIDRKFVDRFYAIPAWEIWQVSKQFIKEEQEKRGRGGHHLWEFQQFAERVQYVKGNHPAYTKRETWPRNPRHKYPYTCDFPE